MSIEHPHDPTVVTDDWNGLRPRLERLAALHHIPIENLRRAVDYLGSGYSDESLVAEATKKGE